MSVLVVGASGRVGRHVVSQLAASGVPVRALFRNECAAALPAGVEAVQGDLTVSQSLEPCLAGVDSVFLVWDAARESAAPAIKVIAARAKRIVFLSSPYTNGHPFFQRAQPNALALLHAEIETLIRESGREFVFLRPGMFAGNALWWWGEQIRSGDVVRWPRADAPTAPIDERDIAAVAVRALLDGAGVQFEQVLTGPEALTHRDQVALIGDVLGRRLRYEEMADDEFLSTFPAGPGEMLLKAWGGAMEAPALVTTAVADITGRPPRSFSEWASDHAGGFARSVHA